jgi:sec-independent protein translocase protein TatA
MGIGVWELLIILAIVLVIFGAKKLRNLGGDLGTAIKAFKTSMKEDDATKSDPERLTENAGEPTKRDDSPRRVIDAEVVNKKNRV